MSEVGFVSHARKRGWAIVALVALAIGLAGIIPTTFASSASATDATTPLQCLIDTKEHPAVIEESHQEQRYRQVTPGAHHEATTHEEWRFRTRTVTYGEVEHKYVHSTYNFVDGGTTNVNGHTVSGHWVGGYTNTWRAIPDSIINAVWGSSGIPSNLIGGSEANPKGSVNLNVYGGPNANVSYYAATESNPSGYTAWGPWSNWSTTNPGADTDTLDTESMSVSDNNAYDDPDVTTYYVADGSPSSNEADASWVLADPDGDGPWTQFDERKVVDIEAKDAWTEYIYGPCDQPCVADFNPATGYVNPDEVGKEPLQTPDGLKFGQGNLIHFPGNGVSVLGLHDLGYTVVSSTGPSPAYKMEVVQASAPTYATWNWEPYMNGYDLDATGTFSNIEDGIWWTSKIANPNPGSQSNPIPLAQLAALYPSATVLSYGPGVGSTTDSVAVVSEMQFLCGTGNFVKEAQDIPLYKLTGPTCAAPGRLDLIDGPNYAWPEEHSYGPGKHTIVATAINGVRFKQGPGVSEDGSTFTLVVTVQPKDPQGCLAYTGADDSWKLIAGGSIALIALGATLYWVPRRRNGGSVA